MDDGGEAAHVVRARELVDQASAILLDFDGPVCAVFSGIPASEVSRDLVAHLRSLAVDELAPYATEDPLEVLARVAIHTRELSLAAEAFLAAREVEAVAVASPTPGCNDFLVAMAERGCPVAVVSNNSPQAILRYLRLQEIDHLVKIVCGRAPRDPSLMKPHPHSLHVALRALGTVPSDGLMIGDSTTDIEAARRAGTLVVGLANKSRKTHALQAAGADTVIPDMWALTR